jgi:hypothetical protein
MLEEGDRVVVVGLWQLEVDHGLAEANLGTARYPGTPVEVETIPRSQADHPGWLDREALLSPKLLDDARSLESESRALGNRIWLVRSPPLPIDPRPPSVFEGWRLIPVMGNAVIEVDLLEPPGPSSDY